MASKISGSDLDGDIYWICWEQSFVKQFRKRDYSYKLTILKNEEKMENEYTYNEKNEKIKKTWTKIDTIDFNKTEDIINSNLRIEIINSLKNKENMDNINNKIRNLCLKYYVFYHNNYKLPTVSKNHLSLIYDLFKEDAFKDGSLNDEIEKHAFYHSIEVDFQKTGETSTFISKRRVPTFLMKKEQYKLSNNLIKIKEIYDEFEKINKEKIKFSQNTNLEFSEDNSSINSTQSNESNLSEKNFKFYDFFVSRGKYQKNDINRNNLKLFEKMNMIKNKNNLSFIYQLYELISFYPAMQDSFLNSIYLMTEEFFYENDLTKMTFKFSKNVTKKEDNFYKIIKRIININKKYEYDIRYLMKENNISIELELIYFNEFIEPKKEVFKHDIEDYRKNLYESVNLIKKKCITDLENIRNEYKLVNEDIKNILFLILFWVPEEDIMIINEDNGNYTINLNKILRNDYKRIKSIKYFIEDLVSKKTLHEINNFFYENIKCISLYFLYCSFFDGNGD